MAWLLLVFLACGNSLADEGCGHTTTAFRCVKYVKNYDGDTITFKIPGVHPIIGDNINIRLSGVDTPEIRTKNQCEKDRARAAKALVQNLLKRAKRIDLESVSRGKYFRIVADVKVDGKSLTDYLLKNKLAYRYAGGKKEALDWCNRQRIPANKK